MNKNNKENRGLSQKEIDEIIDKITNSIIYRRRKMEGIEITRRYTSKNTRNYFTIDRKL